MIFQTKNIVLTKISLQYSVHIFKKYVSEMLHNTGIVFRWCYMAKMDKKCQNPKQDQ